MLPAVFEGIMMMAEGSAGLRILVFCALLRWFADLFFFVRK